MATLRRCLVALNGCAGPKYFQAGDSSIKPGYVVMEDDSDEVKVCSTSGTPIGVAGCTAYHDLNTVYSAGERVPVFLLHTNVEIYVLHDGNAAGSIAKGDNIIRSPNTAGNVTEQTAWSSKSTTYTASDFTEAVDTDHFVVGIATETKTITSGTAAYFKILLR